MNTRFSSLLAPAALSILFSTSANALDVADLSGVQFDNGTLGTSCTYSGILIDNTAMAPNLGISSLTINDGTNDFDVGNRYAPTGTSAPSFPILTAAVLESCGYGNVANFALDDANSTYIADNFIGVTFTADDPADMVRKNFTVGYRGVTDTAFVVEATPVPATAAGDSHIAGFLQNRATNLAANQPKLTRFLSREGRGHFSANVTRGNGDLAFSSTPTANVWGEFSASWSENNSTSSSYVLGTIGAHRQLHSNLLVGAMLEFDTAKDSNTDATVEGTGWLVGPYFVAKSKEHPLYFEGRLLYGRSDNTLDTGSATGDFTTDRWLAQTRVTGEYDMESYILFPYFDLTHTIDNQEAFTDSAATDIAAQKLRLTRAQLGLGFSKPLAVASGNALLTGGLSGVFSRSEGSADFGSGSVSAARVELGLDYDLSGVSALNIGAFYDGLGRSNFESYGLHANWAMSF